MKRGTFRAGRALIMTFAKIEEAIAESNRLDCGLVAYAFERGAQLTGLVLRLSMCDPASL